MDMVSLKDLEVEERSIEKQLKRESIKFKTRKKKVYEEEVKLLQLSSLEYSLSVEKQFKLYRIKLKKQQNRLDDTELKFLQLKLRLCSLAIERKKLQKSSTIC